MTHRNPPIEVVTDSRREGEVTYVRVRFGPHFAVTVHDDDGEVSFKLVSTHHGFRADATQLNGGLERIVNEVRAAHPELAVD